MNHRLVDFFDYKLIAIVNNRQIDKEKKTEGKTWKRQNKDTCITSK